MRAIIRTIVLIPLAVGAFIVGWSAAEAIIDKLNGGHK